jgi:hypothetical protein
MFNDLRQDYQIMLLKHRPLVGLLGIVQIERKMPFILSSPVPRAFKAERVDRDFGENLSEQDCLEIGTDIEHFER